MTPSPVAPAERPAISVVLCTYNRAESLGETLRSLAEMQMVERLSWELIVVDNNSSDRTCEVTEQFAATSGVRVRYLFEGRQGKSFALNTGIAAATGDIVAFTDDDVTVDREWLVGIWQILKDRDCIGVGGRIVPVWTQPKPEWLLEEGPYRLMQAIVSFEMGNEPCLLRVPPFGANMAFRRTAFERYGLFRTDLGPGYKGLAGAEDSEICRRMMAAGETLIYAPGAVIYHPVEPHRARRSYFKSWYFKFGRAAVRSEGWTPGVRYFGVPRHLFRLLARNLILWTTALNPQRRFYYKLQCYLTAGSICEARQLSRERKP
jgi:glycosyltransferase involved in cell wall biosynthesis